MNPDEALARQFHETYERLAPTFDYSTRTASAVPWEDVPENNKALMIAVAGEIIEHQQAAARADNHQLREKIIEVMLDGNVGDGAANAGHYIGLMADQIVAAAKRYRAGARPQVEPTGGGEQVTGHALDCKSNDWGWDGIEGDSGEPCNCYLASRSVACPHWEPGSITMRKGCTACAAEKATNA